MPSEYIERNVGRERLGERISSERGEGGDWGEEGERLVQSRRELVTAVGDNRQETHHADIYTVVFKNTAFSYPALDLPILLPCAPHLPPLLYHSRSLAIGNIHRHTNTHKHTHTHTDTQTHTHTHSLSLSLSLSPSPNNDSYLLRLLSPSLSLCLSL